MGRRRGNYKFLDKFSWYVPGVGGMFALLAWLLVGALFGGLAVVLLTAICGQNIGMEYGNLLSYPLMFIPPMLYASVKSNSLSMTEAGRKLDNNHYAPLGGILCAILAMLGTLSLGFWADGITSLLPPMPPTLEEVMKSLTGGNFIINFLTVCIFAPVCEEWLCRGMVMRGLLCRTRTKPVWAIIISALFFALIHLNPWQAIPAFLMGCLFGYVYYKTGSLKLTMLMHFTNNTFALVCGHIDELKDMNSWSDFIMPPLYLVLVAAALIVTALVAIGFSKIKTAEPEGNLDKVPSLFDSYEN
ncbi:MAG: CPBP family intramembrane metalloprotease [Bacteroidales bacterium]|nr:CPBP family intramembrane metalloprotease [Bacteroidales bacterium]